MFCIIVLLSLLSFSPQVGGFGVPAAYAADAAGGAGAGTPAPPRPKRSPQIEGVAVSVEQVFLPAVADPGVLPLFGQTLGLNSDASLLCIGSPGGRPLSSPTTVGAGRLDCYRRGANSTYLHFQTLETGGQIDHLATLTVAFHETGSGEVELYASAWGTPLGDAGAANTANDRKGCILLYRLNSTGLFQIKQVIDAATPGLGELTPGIPSTANSGAKMGLHFALDRWMALSAHGQNITNSSTGVSYLAAGAVYIMFRPNTQHEWTFVERLTLPGGVFANHTYFGYAVAFTRNQKFLFVSDANILAAPPDEVIKTANSKVYVFERQGQGFTYRQTLGSDQPQALSTLTGFTDGFGCELHADENWVLIVACMYSVSGKTRGAGFFAHYETVPIQDKQWVVRQKVESDRAADLNTFGVFGAALKDGIAVIADPARTGNFTYQGAAQVYKLNAADFWETYAVLTYPAGSAYNFLCSGVALTVDDGGNVYVVCGTDPIMDLIIGGTGLGPVPRAFTPFPDPPFFPGYAVLFKIAP
jgi:hypothetical protein